MVFNVRSRGPSSKDSGISRVKLGGVPRLGVGVSEPALGVVIPDVGVVAPDVGVVHPDVGVAGVTIFDGISTGRLVLVEVLVNSCQSVPPS